MENEKYCYIIGSDLQVYKVKADKINECFEYIISPLAIKYEIDNKSINEVLELLDKELHKDLNNKQ